jgi:peptidyl-prolyl cis-trans isomerase B (cyclophilin B)
VPTDKRARHKALREARLAELRRAQQRRRNLKRGGVVAAVVAVALVIALLTTLGGHKHHSSTVATKPGSSTTSSTSSTVPAASAAVKPLSLSKLESYLIRRTPPAHSAACANPTAAKSSTTTTTIPARSPAVSIVAAPKDVGFPALDGSSPRYTAFSSPPPFCINVNDTYVATFETTAGTFRVTLLPRYAPVTVNNFVFLAGYHFFDGLSFFRVIPGFATQGGSPANSETGQPAGPGYTIPDEYPRALGAYDSGALAMANTGQPHTGGSQFFFVAGNGGASLGKPAYSVFGQVTSGLSVANAINEAGNANPQANGIPPAHTYTISRVLISVTS